MERPRSHLNIARIGAEDPEGLTVDERIKVDQARLTRRVTVGVLIFLAVVAAGFLTPLIVFLTRIAAGG